ncbi:MAG: hypothetical protein SGI77_24190 [Pirellulaceae bacterium]|nr:hypothetical protein [Pirellulaceae bacterium]
MHKLFFWLNWHAGDLALTRPLVRQILAVHDVQITWGCWRNQAHIVEDLPVKVVIDPRDDKFTGPQRPSLMHLCPPGHIPVCLWVGVYPDTNSHQWEAVVEIYNRQVRDLGFPMLQISSNYVPMLDFAVVDVTVAENAIFVENGATRSGHSSFEFDLPNLAYAFPEFNFYSTADPKCELPNVFNCGQFNLRELSSVSNQCIAIVGKGSGPFCSTLTEINRYKPRAVMRYHPVGLAQTIWDYPGNPLQHLESQDDLLRFLQTVRRRLKRRLIPNQRTELDVANVSKMPEEFEAARIGHFVQQYQRQPGDSEYVQGIAEIRNWMVDFWNRLDATDLEYAYRGAWGKIQNKLLSIDVRDIATQVSGELPALPASPDFEINPASHRYSIEAERFLIIAMLIVSPDKLPSHITIEAMPDWLRCDWLLYSSRFQSVFQHIGQTEAYARHIQHTVKGIANCLSEEPSSPYHSQLSILFVEHNLFHPLPLTDWNLKSFQTHRASIAEHVLRHLDFKVDVEFPASLIVGRKPRLGIFASQFDSKGGSLATLAWFEHLGNQFDIFLYYTKIHSSPFEQYCISRVRTNRVLPSDVDLQVPIIREDELDLFLISGDFVSDIRLTMLALHRLARVQIAANSSATTGIVRLDGCFTGSYAESTDGPVETEPSALAAGSSVNQIPGSVPEASAYGSQENGNGAFSSADDSSRSYAETPLLLEGSGFCLSTDYRDPGSSPPIDRSQLNLPPNAVVFCSTANMLAITPELFARWAEILAKTPSAALMMLPFEPTHGMDFADVAIQHYYQYASNVLSNHGVDPARLRMLAMKPYPDFDSIKQVLVHADVFLDSFPTANQKHLVAALQTGIPTITCCGKQRRSALSAAIVEELSPEIAKHLVVDSMENYVARAIELGSTPQRRQILSQQILEAISHAKFLNSKHFANQLISVFNELLKPSGK